MFLFSGVYLLYKAHIRLLCCAVMPNPHRLSVGVPWAWPARRGRSTWLPLQCHWPSWRGSFSDWLGRVPPICWGPIIIRPSPTRPRPLTVAIAALPRAPMYKAYTESYVNTLTHTYTHTKRRHYQTSQTQSISREACGTSRIIPVGPWLSFALSSLLFFYF